MHILGKGYASFKENKLQTWWYLDSKETLPFPQNPGIIIEEHIWIMIISTKEPVYCLGTEGNQCRVEQKGGI